MSSLANSGSVGPLRRLYLAPVRLAFTVSVAALSGAALFGCGATEPSGAATPSGVSSAPTGPVVTAKPIETAPAAKGPTARDRLQGKWEIARFQSDKGIPDEAMPMMATLFSKLRLEFSGRSAIARIEGSPTQELASFDVGYENGDDFTLFAPGWMFDGAKGRFAADGTVELKDTSERWPGVSSLKRAP